MRSLPRGVIANVLRDQPNQKARFDMLKTLFAWLEKAGLMDPVENSFSGLAIRGHPLFRKIGPEDLRVGTPMRRRRRVI